MITWTPPEALVVMDVLVMACAVPRVLPYVCRRQCTTPLPHETFGALYGVVRAKRLKGLGRLGTITAAQACTFTYVTSTSWSHAHQQPTNPHCSAPIQLGGAQTSESGLATSGLATLFRKWQGYGEGSKEKSASRRGRCTVPPETQNGPGCHGSVIKIHFGFIRGVLGSRWQSPHGLAAPDRNIEN